MNLETVFNYLQPVIEYQNLYFLLYNLHGFWCTVCMKVMSEFKGVKTHLPGDEHLHGNIIYLQNGSLSPHNFQRFVNSVSEFISSVSQHRTDEHQQSYQELLIQVSFSKGRCHRIGVLLCYPSFKHLHCKRGWYSYKADSGENSTYSNTFLK